MSEKEGVNSEFGLPQVQETAEQRIERIRAKAAQVASAEADEILLKQMLAEERAKIAPVSPVGRGFSDEYSRVIIDQGNDKRDQTFVPLGINGYIIKVPRGEEVIIPTAFITECLEQAVEEITVKSQGGYTTRPAHRFHWRVISVASAAEYKAYIEAQKAKAQREIAQAA